jgi:hypothetical protein
VQLVGAGVVLLELSLGRYLAVLRHSLCQSVVVQPAVCVLLHALMYWRVEVQRVVAAAAPQ